MSAIFPKSADRYLRLAAVSLAAVGASVIGLYAYLTQPRVMDTGYSPVQPVAYSHKLHAGNPGMDCLY
ncbi:MAG: hypothetical protein HUU41_05525 [Bryobacteraceae bacterium]|nr:hypothetical protein [Bryobacterales bacterium]MEB2361966.1 hypothetical protein [Bryobacterales bacterium]NUN00552.1 hypothetical protein [Bryobacteraceae bacterium]